MSTADFVEAGLIVVVVLFARKFPKFTALVACVLGAAKLFSHLRTPEPFFVRGTDVVGGREEMVAALYRMGAGDHDVEVRNDVPIPASVAQDHILVKVAAAGINPSNFKLNKARVPLLRWIFSVPIVGYDTAGVALFVGSDPECQEFAVGDRVYGFARDGSMAEYTTLACKAAAKSPERLSDEEVAGLPVVALTSLDAMERGQVGEGDRVVVVGASGGCGAYGVMLAKARGAHVTGICSTRNVEFVKSLGADVVLDYRSEDDMERLAKLSNIDVVYDTVTSFDPKDPNYEPTLRPLMVDEGKGGGFYEAINGAPLDWIRGVLDMAIFAPLTGRIGWVQRPNYDLFLTCLLYTSPSPRDRG